MDLSYSLKYCVNDKLGPAVIDVKDDLWNTVNGTVYDSEIDGE